MSTWLKPTSQLRFLFHFRRPQSLTSESDPCRQTCACRTGSCCRTCPLGASSRDPQPLPSSPSHPCRRPGRHLPERTHRFGLSCGNDHILSRPLPAKSRRGGKENIPHPSGQVTERSRSWVQARFCSEALVGSLAHGGSQPGERAACYPPHKAHREADEGLKGWDSGSATTRGAQELSKPSHVSGPCRQHSALNTCPCPA